ncbi:hypothetical protein ACOMHN_051263 [Nucella lapillus]
MMTAKEKMVHLLEVVTLLILMTSATVTSSRRHPQHHRRSSNQQRAGQQQEQEQPGEECSEPADLKQRLEGLYGNAAPGQMHDSFLLVPSMRQALLVSPAGLNDTSTCSKVFSGSTKCNYEDAHSSSSGDPCPTYTCLNCDHNRYPRVLLETRCSCKGRCRGIQVQRGQSGRPSCEGVLHPVRVLRRTGCQQGVYTYVTTW